MPFDLGVLSASQSNDVDRAMLMKNDRQQDEGEIAHIALKERYMVKDKQNRAKICLSSSAG